MKAQTVRIACQGADIVEIEQLVPTQGELKSLSKENYAKLRRQIEETGFAFPFHVWKSNGTLNLIGGHQRLRVLKEMRASGWTVPHLPVVWVEANDLREAMQRVLQDVSQYGEVERQGLYEFMTAGGFGPGEIAELFHIPALDIPSFNAEYFFDNVGAEADDKEKAGEKGESTFDSKHTGSKEYGQDEFKTFAHKCPRCGFAHD